MTGKKADNLADGYSLGHYRITSKIGAGGMGVVYLAEDTRLRRKVALKILPENIAQDSDRLRRFEQEAFAASALNHPNILTIYEFGVEGETHFLAAEFVEGETLRGIFNQKTLKLSEVLDISIQIAGALSVAHGALIIHRDIKPENIMIRPDGFVKVLDFGLAKLVGQKPIGTEQSTVIQNETAKGVILGTVNYMSPEQAQGERVDERTDIFSFGVMLYEMIAGRTPFGSDSMPETFSNLMNSEPQPLLRFAANVPSELQRIVSKTLRKNKDERYQTMRDILADLKDLRETVAFDERSKKTPSPDAENATAILQAPAGKVSSQTDETNYGFARQIKQRKLLAGSVLIALLVGAIGLSYYFLSAKKSPSNVGGKKSLAVLPFANASQDANAEYLSDGITESIINNLSQLSGLRVMSRSSAFRFKNNQTDAKNIGSQLGVESLVTGDIKQLGDKFIINVRLIDTSDDSQIWGNQYVKISADIIAAQEEIAEAVAQNLRLKLTRQPGKNYTENAKAYELYLRGRYHFFK